MNGIARCHRAALAVVATFMAACAQGGLEPPPATPGHAPVVAAPVTPSTAPTVPPEPTPDGRTVSLPVAFHPQRDPDWCDPADLESWLELDGVTVSPGGEVAVQRALWSYEISHNDGFTLDQWHASPYAVAAAFDHFGNRTDVGDAAFGDVTSAGLVISHSIVDRHEPVIALVDDGSHYVLISGVTLSSAGIVAPPTSLTVHDPWTYGPTRDGYPALGPTAQLSWSDFTRRFTPDDPHDPGIWSGHWVLVAAGLPLRG